MSLVVSVEEFAKRRAILDARDSGLWSEVVASFALSGIEITQDNEVIAGRLLNGSATLGQIIAELKLKHSAT